MWVTSLKLNYENNYNSQITACTTGWPSVHHGVWVPAGKRHWSDVRVKIECSITPAAPYTLMMCRGAVQALI